VRDGERHDGDIADLEARAGAEALASGEHRRSLPIFVLHGAIVLGALERLVRGAGHVNRNAKLLGEGAESGDVIGVLVRNDDGGKGMDAFANHLHAAKGFAGGESGIDQDASAGGGDQCAITAASTSQDRHRHHSRRIREEAVDKGVTDELTVDGKQ